MAFRNFHDAVREHFAAAVPHARDCGMEVTHVDAQGAEAMLPFRREWLGDPERGVIHTGIVTTLIDTVSGLATLAAIGSFDAIATLDLRMDYLRPALAERTVYSRAEVYRLTRSIAFVRAWAWQDSREEPVAVSQSTFMRSQRPSGPVVA
ncbi:MAG TPA: PaaI family thioesterase [Candidatus Binatia bacterium]|nr:PaaI family thioesterase [Candidatus Binatia bacterium]